MRKNILTASVVVLGVILFASSCKSNKESAYKTAYEKAKTKEITTPVPEDEDIIVYTPPTNVPEYPSVNETARTEKITPVYQSESDLLKRYSVVIYSFKNKTNATAAKEEMAKQGYNATVAQNEDDMYRVIIASYDDRATAIAKRNEIKAKYAPRFDDIWILERR